MVKSCGMSDHRLRRVFVAAMWSLIFISVQVGLRFQREVIAAEPVSVSGIYPHLAMFNNEGECGTGAWFLGQVDYG